MELSIDTSGFLFNPKQSDFIERMSVYEEFRLPDRLLNEKTKKEFEIDHEQVLAYIAILYDIKSSLLRDYAVYPERKGVAAEMMGWKKERKTERFSADVEAILLGDVIAINNAIVKYCLLQNSVEFLALVAYSSMFAKASLDAFRTYDKDIFKLINDLKNAIAKSEAALFGGEEVISMRESLYRAVETRRLAIRPEDFAIKLAAGENPVEDANPYGKYKVDNMKFVGDE